MLPGERSVIKVAAMRGHEKYPATEQRWCTENHWVERALAFDEYNQKTAIEVVRVGLGEAQSGHLENMSTVYSLTLQLSAQILDSMQKQFLKKADPNDPDAGKVDTLALTRVVRAINAADVGLRRTLGMPTQFKTEKVDPEDDPEDAVYVINKPKTQELGSGDDDDDDWEDE